MFEFRILVVRFGLVVEFLRFKKKKNYRFQFFAKHAFCTVG